MATTTAAAIRDRAITVIAGLVPSSIPTDAYLPYRNDNDGDFRRFAEQNPASAHRLFQVRTVGTDRPVEATNGDVEFHYVDLIITVAYARSGRDGDGTALGRDDVVDQDRHQIECAVGLNGAANFTPATNADCTWRNSEVARVEDGQACDFLVIRQTMSFYRQMT